MNFSRRKSAAACLPVIDLLEECTEDESGERWWKRGRTGGWNKRRNESGMMKLVEELRVEDTAAYKEMLRMNCETFEKILTAIGHVITKTADRKTIMNYHTRGQTRKIIIDYHEELEQALNLKAPKKCVGVAVYWEEYYNIVASHLSLLRSLT